MGLLTELFANAVDDEYRLAQDLVAIAIADGSISKEEYNMIVKICRSMGISTDVIDAYISGGLRP
jgi:tellurite resistance protein